MRLDLAIRKGALLQLHLAYPTIQTRRSK